MMNMWHICDEAKYLPIVFYMYIYINIYTVVYRFIYMYDCVGQIKRDPCILWR